MNKIYIAGITTILPQEYPPGKIIETFYPEKFTSERCRALTNRLVHKVGINSRPTVLDLDLFPTISLLSNEYTPLNWGIKVLDNFMNTIELKDIGHLSVSYNISSHKDFIPNLACQIALQKKLTLDSPAEELVGYGCASGILSLKSANKYCQHNNKAAIVFMYEHSLTLADPIYDISDEDFKANLRAHLLFSDGAVGLLILPESMVKNDKERYMEIIDIDTGFHLGDAIQMKKGKFLVGDNVKEVMPRLVSNNSILPVLKNNNLSVEQVEEWSIHQGGIPVLQKFMDEEILGLSKKQIIKSLELFRKYGNFSTPSCFFVLNSFFKNEINKGQYGAIVSFGAGYYYGTVLYRKHF